MSESNSTNGDIYLMLDGALRVFPDEDSFNNLYADQSHVIKIDTVKAYPQSQPINYGVNLTGSDDGKIFLLIDGTKRCIVDSSVFNRYGFDENKVNKIIVEEAERIPDGISDIT